MSTLCVALKQDYSKCLWFCSNNEITKVPSAPSGPVSIPRVWAGRPNDDQTKLGLYTKLIKAAV